MELLNGITGAPALISELTQAVGVDTANNGNTNCVMARSDGASALVRLIDRSSRPARAMLVGGRRWPSWFDGQVRGAVASKLKVRHEAVELTDVSVDGAAPARRLASFEDDDKGWDVLWECNTAPTDITLDPAIRYGAELVVQMRDNSPSDAGL